MVPLQGPYCDRTRQGGYKKDIQDMYSGISDAVGKLLHRVLNLLSLKGYHYLVLCSSAVAY
jgi:hypothetical protein